MPSLTHESLVDLFRECPALAPQLLSHAGPGLLGRGDGGITPRLTAAEFADINAHEYRADAVIRLDGDDGRPIDIIIVEVQLDRDDDKHASWPFYMVGARARHDCPATVLVITIDASVAAWCATPIALDRNGSVVNPVVLGPGQFPRIIDIEEALEAPEIAILSAAVHGQEPDAAEVAVAGLTACNTLDSERCTRYADVILSALGPIARQALEKLMSTQNYEYQSDFARKYVAQGRDEGRDEGRVEGQRAIVLRQLESRFSPLAPDALERIEKADVATLETWADRLLSADTLEQVWSD